MASYYFLKSLNSLKPADQDAKDAIDRFAFGEVVHIKGMTKPRNYQFHKKFMALVAMVAEARDIPTSSMLDWVKIQLGHYDEVVLEGDKVAYKLKSISFAAMDEVEFNRFYDDAVKAFVELTGSSEDDLREAVMNFAGDGW